MALALHSRRRTLRSPRPSTRNSRASAAHRAHRVRELRLARRARGGGHRAHQQVRRGSAGQALLRRLREGRRRREPRARARQGALRRRPRQRPAARRGAGEHGRLLRVCSAGRHRPRHEPGDGRAPDARLARQLLRQVVQRRALRAGHGDRDASTTTSSSASPSEHRPQDDHRRGVGLSARHRLRALRGDRRRGRRGAHGRHGAHRRPRRHGCAPVARARTPTSSPRPSHKTLRGPRSGFILCKEEWATALDKAVFPGLQGGPLEHIIAAKAVAFRRRCSPSSRPTSTRSSSTRRRWARRWSSAGLRLVSGGTDNHLHARRPAPGRRSPARTPSACSRTSGFTVNKNAIPNDPESPFVTSGIRVGSAAMTTRGFSRGRGAHDRLPARRRDLQARRRRARSRRSERAVDALLDEHPLYPEL